MPLDPSIITGIQPAQTPSPLEIVSTLTQIQGQRDAAEARRLAAEEARAKRTEAQEQRDLQKAIDQRYAEALSINPDTQEITLNTELLLRDAPPDQKPALYEAILKDQDRMNDNIKRHMALETSRRAFLGIEGQDIEAELGNPKAWPTRLRRLRDSKVIDARTYEDLLKYTEAPNIVAVAQQWQRQAAAGKPGEGFTLGEGQTRFGPTGQVIASGPAKAPPPIAGFTLAPGAIRYGPGGEVLAKSPAPSPLQLVPIMGPQGPVLVREEQAIGATPFTAATGARPATEGERKAAGFHGQMQQALTTINQLESKLTDTDLYQIQSLPQEGITGAINRGAMSDTAKQYIQAFNQFTEARLRPVSGAAIAASEYERDRATYGKQYGETPTLATQRQAARTQALEALRVMAGSAIEDKSKAAVPDLTGLPKGRGRRFTEGPFAGQTWALDDNGKAYQVK